MDIIETSGEVKAVLKIGIYDQDYILKVQLKIDEKLNMKKEERKKNYQIVIDNSGSMAGTNMNLTIKLCFELVLHILRNQPNSKISLMTFNSFVTKIPDLHLMSIKKLNQSINSIIAEGGTVFYKTFDELGLIASEFTSFDEELIIVYLTDGQMQSETPEQVKQSLIGLKKILNSKIKNVEVHALGMGVNHDPVILDQIISLSSSQCTYQFIKTSSEIDSSFKTIVGIIDSDFFELNLERKDGTGDKIQLLKGSFSKTEKIKNCIVIPKEVFKKVFETTQDINQDNIDQYKLTLSVNYRTSFEIPFKFIDMNHFNEETHPSICISSKVKQFIDYLDTTLKQQISDLQRYVNNNKKNLDQQKLKEYYDIFLKYRDSLSQNLVTIFKISKQERDKIYKYSANLSSRLEEAIKISKDLFEANSIASAQIAELNQLSYSQISNKLFARRIAKRKEASVEQFNEKEKMRLEIIQEYKNKESELREIFKPFDFQLSCFLSCSDLEDSILQGDCLCATFSVTRSELAIVRPESLKIKAVQPSIISATSFIDCLKYSLNISLEKSGTFKKEEGSIVSGMMREVINAAMPLYIHEAHWRIAKLWLEPILGWVVTLNPLGYHHAQKRTVPFLVYNQCAKQMIINAPTEYALKQIDMVRRTCQVILEEETDDAAQLLAEKSQGLTFKNEIIKQFNEFKSDPCQRLQDSVPNIEIFLSKLYISSQIGWIKLLPEESTKFFRNVIEEQLRRKIDILQPQFPISALHQLIKEDDAAQIENFQNTFLLKFKSELNLIHFFKNLFKGMDHQKALSQINELSLKDLLIADSNDQIKSLFIQDMIQSKDRVRKNCILTNTYFDPYDCFESVFKELQRIQESSGDDEEFFKSMSLKPKTLCYGNFNFTCPYIPTTIQSEVSQLISTDDVSESIYLINQISLVKKSPRWFVWVLIANKAINLDNKLIQIKKILGSFPILTNYSRYILTKGNLVSAELFKSLERP